MGLSNYLINHMLKTRGRVVTVSGSSQTTYDTASGTYTETPDTPVTVKGYLSDQMLEQEQSIVSGSKRLLISPVDTSGQTVPEPKVGNEVTGWGDKLKIVSVSEIAEGSIVSCYICGVDR